MIFENSLIYLVILLFTIISAIICNGIEEYKNKNKTKMSFMESMDLTGLPIVTFLIDNKKYNFLLDTGANYSVINSSLIDDITHTKIDKQSSVIGMEGNAVISNFIDIILTYKNKKFQESFQVINMDSAFNKIKKESGVAICGILGSEFFRRYNYILDFKELIVYSKK